MYVKRTIADTRSRSNDERLKIENVETKKKQWVTPILIKTISSKRVVKCQIDSGASAARWESQTL